LRTASIQAALNSGVAVSVPTLLSARLTFAKYACLCSAKSRLVLMQLSRKSKAPSAKAVDASAPTRTTVMVVVFSIVFMGVTFPYWFLGVAAASASATYGGISRRAYGRWSWDRRRHRISRCHGR
jgi:hypothetical protein